MRISIKNVKIVPQIFQDAYSHFKEDKKNSEMDFIYDFHRVIESIKMDLFQSMTEYQYMQMDSR